MSWEIVTLTCVTEVVLLAVYLVKSKAEKPGPISADEFELLKTAVGAVKTEHEAIHKLAEDTKKLLSQQNLAQSLRAQR